MTKVLDETFEKETLIFLKLGNIAVQKAKEENRRLGIPNVFGKDGVLYYEMPDGTITTERPKIFED